MITRSLRALLWLVSTLAVVGFTFLAARGIGHPRPFDPVEPALLDLATRLTHEEPLYAEPSIPAPAPPMPGFPVLISLLVRLWGPHPWEPRLLTLLATLGAAALVAGIVRLETRSWTLGVASGGFMLTGLGLLAGRPGVARPEALMLLLVLAGLVALRHLKGVRGVVLAVGPLAAAWFVQPLAAWFIAATAMWLAFEDRRRFIAFLLGVAVLWGGGYVLLSHTLGPWFNYAAWDAPLGALHFEPARLLRYVGDQLLGKLGVLTLAAVLLFALPAPPWRGPGGLWTCVGIAAVAAGLLATQSTQAGPHSLTCSVVVLALVGPMAIQRVTQHLSAWPGSSRMGGQGVVLAALALQFIMFFANVPPSLFSRVS